MLNCVYCFGSEHEDLVLCVGCIMDVNCMFYI